MPLPIAWQSTEKSEKPFDSAGLTACNTDFNLRQEFLFQMSSYMGIFNYSFLHLNERYLSDLCE